MNHAELQHIRIDGIASSVPKRTAHNLDCDLIPLKERDLFIRSTGIEQRRVAAKGTCTSDLCVHAAEQLMDQLGWHPSDLRIIVLVTQTPDHITPSTAAIIQNRLGCSTDCAAFDVNLGCSGYVYGLWTLASLLQGLPDGSKALLLAGDVSTSCISPNDHTQLAHGFSTPTGMLFAHGGPDNLHGEMGHHIAVAHLLLFLLIETRQTVQVGR